jgi:hypothetical protein
MYKMYRSLSEPIECYSTAAVPSYITTVTTAAITDPTTYTEARMINYLQHSKEIDGDFSALYFHMYSKGYWKIELGYKPLPIWYANSRKTLLDWQRLASVDCDGEYLAASQGHLDYSCCSSGSTLITGSSQSNCCPPGMVYNSTNDLCYQLVNSIGVPTIPCPCCPTGYTYDSLKDICVGTQASDVADPIECTSRCQNLAGVVSPLVACSTLAPDSIILGYPGLDNTCCVNTQVVPWAGCC